MQTEHVVIRRGHEAGDVAALLAGTIVPVEFECAKWWLDRGHESFTIRERRPARVVATRAQGGYLVTVTRQGRA